MNELEKAVEEAPKEPDSGPEHGGPERRRNPRYACSGPVEVGVFDAEFLFRGEVRDLSLTGCYVQTRARLRLRPDTEVELRFSLEGENVRCLARVKSLRPGVGAGFEFQEFDERSKKAILRLIRALEEAASADGPEAEEPN
ncbi:MAG TPA: PilZ domain-containing protein [Terracidiphilus sp.]|nr:PilZ domain-containing protein [Terracidiphilus sp.]